MLTMSSLPPLVVLDERRLVREGTSQLLCSAADAVVASYSSFDACAAGTSPLAPESVLIVGQLVDPVPPAALRGFRMVQLTGNLSELIHDIVAGTPRMIIAPVSPPRRTQSRPQYSAREQQILDLIAQGLSAGQMAKVLGLSRSTIEHHKQQMFARVGVQSQAHAVAMSRGTSLSTSAG